MGTLRLTDKQEAKVLHTYVDTVWVYINRDGCTGLLFGVNQHFLRVGGVWKDKLSQEHQTRLILQTPRQGDGLHTAAVLQLT